MDVRKMTREDITPIAMEATQTIISLDVAEMLETRHDSLLRKIEGINKDLVDHNFVVNEYWLES